MEVKAEAQKIMTLAVMKLYNSRLQKGGMKLHRNLLLSLVMRNAKEMYLSAKLEAGRAFPSEQEERMVTEPDTPAMETIGSISEDNNNADTETQPTDCHNTEDPEVTKTVVTEMETDCNSCDKPTGGLNQKSLQTGSKEVEVEQSENVTCDTTDPLCEEKVELVADCNISAQSDAGSLCSESLTGTVVVSYSLGTESDLNKGSPCDQEMQGEILTQVVVKSQILKGNRQSRKRSSPAGKKGSEPESVPSKKARLEEEPQQEQGDQKNAYHHNVSSLVKVMEASFSGFLGHVTCSDPPSCDQKSTCRHGERMLTKMSTLVRAVGVC
ncbi:immediate early response 2b [Latimeria chalumnae]|uniref:immediate early response 2b n=1 Tax=Latimeria chalumnae TaxID=7897 RepID=UPI0003C15E95|nr:PREDICTED: immediate early response gene 2 protein [Latimeria chalumnae]|eukprot:XP_005994380.1 PREDICTED: immediate early response gene 2 protein [Latimeria chalumnae]